jgi:hypothetical protein
MQSMSRLGDVPHGVRFRHGCTRDASTIAGLYAGFAGARPLHQPAAEDRFMPIDYSRDDELRCVTIDIRDAFDFREALEVISRLRHDGVSTYALLADARFMTGWPGIGELRDLIAASASLYPEGAARGALAIVAVHSIGYRVACAYASLASWRQTVRVFRNRDEAMNWLMAQAMPAAAATPSLHAMR